MRRRRPVLLALAWLPCVLCAAAWVASYQWVFGAFGDGYYVWVERGALYGTFAAKDVHDTWEASAKPLSDTTSSTESLAGLPVDRRIPFRVLHTPPGWDQPALRVPVIALCAPTLLLAVPPLWLTRRPRRRRTPGLCPA